MLKSVCKELIAITITKLSQISLFNMIAAQNHLYKNQTLANILLIESLNFFGLFIFG